MYARCPELRSEIVFFRQRPFVPGASQKLLDKWAVNPSVLAARQQVPLTVSLSGGHYA